MPQDVIRCDATTVSGDHEVTEGGLVQFGQSKDDPTRPQIKVMMGSLDPLGMPLSTQQFPLMVPSPHTSTSTEWSLIGFDQPFCALTKSVPRLPQRLAAGVDATKTNKYNSLKEFTRRLWCRPARACCQKVWPWGQTPPTHALRLCIIKPTGFLRLSSECHRCFSKHYRLCHRKKANRLSDALV